MSKAAAVIVLLAFSWLQADQLCDASEDIIEDLPTAAQLAAGHRLSYSSPTSPDDDDGQIPQIFDQTLMPGTISSMALVALPPFAVVQQTAVFVLADSITGPRGLSPPQSLPSTSVGLSNQAFVASLRSLAPPVA